MGAGIAELIARNGIPVTFIEMDDVAVEAGYGRLTASLDRQVNRGRLDAGGMTAIVGRITGTTDWSALGGCDLIVEAVPEVLQIKQDTFKKIDAHARHDAIIATNTSSLPVMDIAVVTKRPNRVLGFHFFNPAPVMKLIELVRTVITDDAAVETASAFAETIGKKPVVVGDRRGFIANQLLFPYLNQAVWMVEGGYATREDIDTAMRLGAGLPMGPIALTDLVGIDTFLGIMDAIHSQFNAPRFAPRPVLSQLAMAGFTGRKAGRGFYTYAESGSSTVVPEGAVRPAPDLQRISHWTHVGVVGTGVMASGIAEVCARAGYTVTVLGRTRAKGESLIAKVARSLQGLIDKGRLTEEERVQTLTRLRPSIDARDLGEADIVIEAIAGDLAVKHAMYVTLAGVVGSDTVLATTSSAVAVTSCAMGSDRPERFVGLHFFNPAEKMPLVEIVTTLRASADTVEDARAFVQAIDKVGVLCGDRAGFIVNTLLFPYLNDAVKMLESHYATAEQIDTAMKLGCGYPMGPFELMDTVGLDETLAVIERLHAEYRQPSHAPAPLLRHLVEVGFHGRKTGRGFYVYDE